jgi:hypothetical protein
MKQVQYTCMGKKPFTTRIDDEVLALAQQLADAERRSVTSLIEVAVLEYAARRGAPASHHDKSGGRPVGQQERPKSPTAGGLAKRGGSRR